MEEMPSQAEEEAVPEPDPPPAPAPSAPSRSWRTLFQCCCCKGPNQGISRNKIEPVIFQPMNDVYLQLKPHRRLRVIHINGINDQGALPTPTPYYLQNSGSDLYLLFT